MPTLVEKWYEAYLLWDAKDWSMGALAQEIKEQIASGKRPTLATLMGNGRRLSLSESSIQRLASTDERIPEVLAELVEELKAQNPAAEAKTRIVEEGLRALRGRPFKCGQDPEAIAKALADHFPANELARKLADALLAQAQVANGSGSLLDVFAQAIAGRVPHIDGRTMLRGLWAAVVVGGIGALASMASCVASISQRLTPAAPVASAPALAPCGAVTINIGSTIVDEATRQRRMVAEDGPLGALASNAVEMGEKAPPEKWIPQHPFADQKVPPCDAGLYEEPIGGGCWLWVGAANPPCGRLFRSGDKCYRPIAADPKKPVGSNAEAPAKEPR